MCELLWSDPQPGAGRAPSKRGVGVAFGPDVTRAFLEQNGLDLLVRSHEVRSYRGLCLIILKLSFCQDTSAAYFCLWRYMQSLESWKWGCVS